MPLLVFGAPLRHCGRLYNCAVVRPSRPPARRGSEDPPAELSRVLRAPLVRLRPRHRGQRSALVAGFEAPFGPDLVFAAADLPGLVVHAEICEDLWVPIPPSTAGALAGATVLLNLSASNITIGKAETRRLLCHSQSARCIAAYRLRGRRCRRVDHRPRLGRPGLDLRERRRAGRKRALPRRRADRDRRYRPRPAAAGAGPAGHVRRQPARPSRPTRQFRQIPFRLDPPADDLGLRRAIERFPFVPSDPGAPRRRTATRLTTSRSPASCSAGAPPAAARS